MKIAFINDTFLHGRGADIVIYELAKRIGRKHEVYVLTGQTDIKGENFKIIQLNLPKLYTGSINDFFYLRKMKELHKEIEKIDKKVGFEKIIVFHGGLAPAFKDSSKITYAWLGSPPTHNLFRKIASKYFQSLMIKQTVITISKYLERGLKDIGAKKTKVILLGVSKEFKPLKKTIDEGYMLYVGRLEKHKQVSQLIRLSKEVKFPLKVVGYGPELLRLQKLARRLSAEVTFLGKVKREELIKLYQRCSFFVSASKWEGFGLIFVEAGACGKPAIGYDKGSIPEVIKNNKTGFVVDSFKQFEQKARLLKKDKVLRLMMGRKANLHSKKFCWEKISKKFEEELVRI